MRWVVAWVKPSWGDAKQLDLYLSMQTHPGAVTCSNKFFVVVELRYYETDEEVCSKPTNDRKGHQTKRETSDKYKGSWKRIGKNINTDAKRPVTFKKSFSLHQQM